MNFTFKLKSSFLLLIFFASLGQAQQVNVLFVPPGAVRYWHDVTIPMAPAAKKLGINLTIKPIGNTGRVNYEERVLELINSVTNIDWIIWSQRRLATQKILDAMKNRQIKSIDITSGLFKDVQKKIGYPQEKYPHWMAQVINDEFEGGQRMLEDLIALKNNASPEKPLRVIAIGGNKRVASSLINSAGLKAGIAQADNAKLLQLLHVTRWDSEVAKQAMKQLALRYKQFDIIWTANTSIALGAIAQLNEMNYSATERPIIANIGWTEDTFTALENDQLAFSLGGNHLNGLWALILIHDISHGIVPAVNKEQTIIKAPYFKLTKDNLAQVRPFFTKTPWQTANIKQFSKVYNPALTKYNFDFSLLLIPPKVKDERKK